MLLWQAAVEGYEVVVKLLVDWDDIKANSKDWDSQMPLQQVVVEGYKAVVKLLVNWDDVKANLKDQDYQTLLLQAAQ